MNQQDKRDYSSFYLSSNLLPSGFIYPESFNKIVENEITNIEPWGILDGELLVKKFKGLTVRYPKLLLIPFARRFDNDDVACWTGNALEEVVIIHDYSDEIYAFRKKYSNFWGWFRAAIEDMINFE